MASLPEILDHRARHQPDRLGYRYLLDGTPDTPVDLTYRELAEQVSALSGRFRPGQRVVLALDPGLHYVVGFFAILRAGAAAVPAFPPVGKRAVARFHSIVLDCTPDVVLADQKFTEFAGQFPADLPGSATAPEWIFLGDKVIDGGPASPIVHQDPALIQYTSGSTGDPKGIVLTHGNLISNCAVLEGRMGVEEDRLGVSWMPPYHDMGLIGTIVLAMHGGWPLVMISPVHFAQRPIRWLRAITHYRATISVAPNFAFELCAKAITDDELAGIDLSTLRQTFCGAEPLLRSTLDEFAERLRPHGYHDRILMPCYGLAEATLFVSGKPLGVPIRTELLDKSTLERGEARPVAAGTDDRTDDAVPITSCGTVAEGHEVLIVDPESLRPLRAGLVGEIWVHGPSVAAGYLNRPELTAQTFAARPVTGGQGRQYLRTGDLGFISGNELFVTGRIKDLLVIAGRNIYPQDVEQTVRGVHGKLRMSAAFSVSGDAGEEMVVVVEYRDTVKAFAAESAGIRDSIVAAVSAEHGIRPADVRFVRGGGIPMTTSGKVRRAAARDAYRAGTLKAMVAG